MKRILVFCMVFAGVLLTVSASAQATATFKVYGNCGMCEERIEKAVIMKGVKSGAWDRETGQLTVIYNPRKTTVDKIQQRIADVGHDTDRFRARDEVYQKLHACCKYERPKTE